MMSRVHSVETMEESDDNITGITFRTFRLRSSLSSLYQNYDFHLDIVKITGVLVLLSLMSAALAITNNLHVGQSRHNISDCIQLRTHTRFLPSSQQNVPWTSCLSIRESNYDRFWLLPVYTIKYSISNSI
jgi:hypothetical protein